MRVYKFLSSEFALKDIREQRIKISEFYDLNDPFELLPVALPDPRDRAALLNMREELGKTRGLLSFASNFTNPVLWAHYGDKHRGICLGFEALPGETCKQVCYVAAPIRQRQLTQEFMTQILFTKYAGWAYEEEIRCYVTREEEDNGLYYFNFSEGLKLREVIIGQRSCIERSQVSVALTGYSEPVEISKAYLALTDFCVLKDVNGFSK